MTETWRTLRKERGTEPNCFRLNCSTERVWVPVSVGGPRAPNVPHENQPLSSRVHTMSFTEIIDMRFLSGRCTSHVTHLRRSREIKSRKTHGHPCSSPVLYPGCLRFLDIMFAGGYHASYGNSEQRMVPEEQWKRTLSKLINYWNY